MKKLYPLHKLLLLLLTFPALCGLAQVPVISFTSSAPKCSGTAITFTDQTTNTPISWSWSFPGGTPSVSSVQNPTVTYATAGVYTVTLGAANSSFTGTPVTQTISVGSTPAVSITLQPPSCEWNTKTLNATGASSFVWLPGPLTGSNVYVTPTVTTTYTLIASNGACSVTALNTISVIPTYTNAIGTYTTCGAPVNLVCCLPGAVTYSWAPTGFTGPTISVVPSSSQNYTLIASGPNTCIKCQYLVLVSPSPTVTLTFPLGICLGSSATICAGGAVSYTWSPSTGLSATNVPCPVANPTVSTGYQIKGTGSNGCVSTDSLYLTVYPLPNITAASATLCNGTSQAVCASGGLSYSWSPASGLSSTSIPCPTASPSVSTIYSVTGANTNGCKGSTTVNVSVIPSPTISVASATLCRGTTQTVCASGGLSYSWSPGSGLSSSVIACPAISPTATTVYSVTGVNSTSCTSTATMQMYVSLCQGIDAQSMNDNSNAFTLFPNPNKGSFYLRTVPGTVISGIDIYNYAGQLVYSCGGLKDDNILDTGLSKGIYYVKLKANNGSSFRKMIID